MEVGRNHRLDSLTGGTNPAGKCRKFSGFLPVRKAESLVIPVLANELRVVHRIPVYPWWCAGLKSARVKTEFDKLMCEFYGGSIPCPSCRYLSIHAHPDASAQESPRGQYD
jgi:hypothetical protein